MKLTKVQRVLSRRLAYVTASALAAPENRWLAEERDALHTAMRCLGMLDDVKLASAVDACAARVLPATERLGARARRGDELLERTSSLVERLRQAIEGRPSTQDRREAA